MVYDIKCNETTKINVTLHKVKGHSGITENEIIDTAISSVHDDNSKYLELTHNSYDDIIFVLK